MLASIYYSKILRVSIFLGVLFVDIMELEMICRYIQARAPLKSKNTIYVFLACISTFIHLLSVLLLKTTHDFGLSEGCLAASFDVLYPMAKTENFAVNPTNPNLPPPLPLLTVLPLHLILLRLAGRFSVMVTEMELTKVRTQCKDAYGSVARGGGDHGRERRSISGNRPLTRGYRVGGGRKAYGNGYGSGSDERCEYCIQLYMTTPLLTTCSWPAHFPKVTPLPRTTNTNINHTSPNQSTNPHPLRDK
ncbi:hypothetical protein YC2023_037928 [Brassica napus]